MDKETIRNYKNSLVKLNDYKYLSLSPLINHIESLEKRIEDLEKENKKYDKIKNMDFDTLDG